MSDQQEQTAQKPAVQLPTAAKGSYAPYDDENFLYTSPGGTKMIGRLRHFSDCGDSILANEMWVENVYRLDGRTLGGTRKVVDIGCNIGAFALLCCEADPFVEVVGFEPVRHNINLLIKNIIINKWTDRIKVHECAVGKEKTEVEMHPYQAGSWMQGQPSKHYKEMELVMNNGGSRDLTTLTEEQAENLRRAGRTEKVKCIPFSEAMDLACGKGGECDFLKMDCEWSEYDIVESATIDDLKRIKQIAIETHGVTPERFGMFMEKLTRVFRIEVLGGAERGGYIWGNRL